MGLWPAAKVHLTGSRRVNLALPSSDVDFVIGNILESRDLAHSAAEAEVGDDPSLPCNLAIDCLQRLRDQLTQKFPDKVQWCSAIDAKASCSCVLMLRSPLATVIPALDCSGCRPQGLHPCGA